MSRHSATASFSGDANSDDLFCSGPTRRLSDARTPMRVESDETPLRLRLLIKGLVEHGAPRVWKASVAAPCLHVVVTPSRKRRPPALSRAAARRCELERRYSNCAASPAQNLVASAAQCAVSV